MCGVARCSCRVRRGGRRRKKGRRPPEGLGCKQVIVRRSCGPLGLSLGLGRALHFIVFAHRRLRHVGITCRRHGALRLCSVATTISQPAVDKLKVGPVDAALTIQERGDLVGRDAEQGREKPLVLGLIRAGRNGEVVERDVRACPNQVVGEGQRRAPKPEPAQETMMVDSVDGPGVGNAEPKHCKTTPDGKRCRSTDRAVGNGVVAGDHRPCHVVNDASRAED